MSGHASRCPLGCTPARLIVPGEHLFAQERRLVLIQHVLGASNCCATRPALASPRSHCIVGINVCLHWQF